MRGVYSVKSRRRRYNNLVDYWMTNRYTMRYTGGLVPDICQQFTKKQVGGDAGHRVRRQTLKSVLC